jgi:hypothetical protein
VAAVFFEKHRIFPARPIEGNKRAKERKSSAGKQINLTAIRRGGHFLRKTLIFYRLTYKKAKE